MKITININCENCTESKQSCLGCELENEDLVEVEEVESEVEEELMDYGPVGKALGGNW